VYLFPQTQLYQILRRLAKRFHAAFVPFAERNGHIYEKTNFISCSYHRSGHLNNHAGISDISGIEF
jgi:hypothetical protein